MKSFLDYSLFTINYSFAPKLSPPYVNEVWIAVGKSKNRFSKKKVSLRDKTKQVLTVHLLRSIV